MDFEELKTRVSDRYDPDELCDLLKITTEDLVDKFTELVYNSLIDLDIGDPYEEEESSGEGPTHTEVSETSCEE